MSEDNNFPLVSVVIIGKNEKDTIDKCILSIFNQSYPNFEIIYVDDKSTDNTLEKAQRLNNILDSKKNCKRYLTLSVETNFPSKNRNIGLKASKGGIIAFIDGDCIAEHDWLTNLHEQFSTEVGIVGGPITLAHSKNSITTKAIDVVLASYLGSGGSALFYQIRGDREVDEVPAGNLAVYRRLLEKYGGFEENLRYNEDTNLCYRLREDRYRIIYAVKARIYHFIGIDSYIDFMSYFKRYGFERGKNSARSSKFLTIFNILSLALVVSALSLIMLSFFINTAAIIFFYLFLGVVLIELTASLKLAIENKCIKLLFLLVTLFITLHNTYNIAFIFGYMTGLKEAIMGKNKRINAIAKAEN
jgi:glycosyltransferase involved in cell wall biosynthesis